jgi:23S rRNA (pseudouridine1915-N3)-methyltransferase
MEIIICSNSRLNNNTIDDYSDRINKRIKFSVLESKPEKVIKESDYVIVLDEHGQKFDNLSFAKKFDQVMSSGGYKRIVFVVGDAYGVSEEIKLRANLIWSFSDQVFPHKLFAVMLTEQIYRTLEIIVGSPYHHK